MHFMNFKKSYPQIISNSCSRISGQVGDGLRTINDIGRFTQDKDGEFLGKHFSRRYKS